MYDNLFQWFFQTSASSFYGLMEQASELMEILTSPIASLLPDGWLSQTISKLIEWFLPGVSILEFLFVNISLIITVTVVKWLRNWL